MNQHWGHTLRWVWLAALLIGIGLSKPSDSAAIGSGDDSLPARLRIAQARIVKLTGAGGFQRLENYQTGILVSADGFILTVWSYVLDGIATTATLDDGKSHSARLVGFDPQSELALLKIDEVDLPHFDLAQPGRIQTGSRIYGLSNLYGIAGGSEPVSVLAGRVQAIAPLRAVRNGKPFPYRDRAVFLDMVTNNAGSAGGAVVDSAGNLVGVLGKELHSEQTGQYVNFAYPTSHVRGVVERIQSGQTSAPSPIATSQPTEGLRWEWLGIILVPDLLPQTPPFVETIETGSPADIAGLTSDDLLVEVNGQLITSIRSLREKLNAVDRDATVELTYERNGSFQRVRLKANR